MTEAGLTDCFSDDCMSDEPGLVSRAAAAWADTRRAPRKGWIGGGRTGLEKGSEPVSRAAAAWTDTHRALVLVDRLEVRALRMSDDQVSDDQMSDDCSSTASRFAPCRRQPREQ
jgi:hypothetical protein